MRDFIPALKELLSDSVRKNAAFGILLSGGLDSSVLAFLNPEAKAVTVNFKTYGEDNRYSEIVTTALGMRHYKRSVDLDEALEAIPEVIKILKSFDPAIPNDLAAYFALKFAKELGIQSVMTGDGGDELFGGYDFMKNTRELNSYIHRISRKMKFSSNGLANFLDIALEQPYLNREVIALALEIPADLKIKKENGKTWGKWILRKAFEGIMPPEIAWQEKRPLEYGSGMTRLRGIISEMVSEEEFKDNPYAIKFISREHFYYYKIYKDIFGDVPAPCAGEKECPGCGAGLEKTAIHCGVCGYVLG